MNWFEKALKKVKEFFGGKDAGKSKQKCPLMETGLLVAVVRADNRQVVKDADVDIEGASGSAKKADKDGLALFKPIEPGPYQINVTLPGHLADSFEKPEPELETVSLGSCPVHVIKVYPLSTLKVRVLRMEGDKEKFLEGVKIHIKGRDERDGQTPEIKDGWITFDKIKSGDYEVSITSLGGIYEKTYEAPTGSGTSVPPGETKEMVLRVNPTGWVEFMVVEADTDPEKVIEGITITAKLPGDQTIARRPGPDNVVSYRKLANGKASVKSVEVKDHAWEFVSIESKDKG